MGNLNEMYNEKAMIDFNQQLQGEYRMTQKQRQKVFQRNTPMMIKREKDSDDDESSDEDENENDNDYTYVDRRQKKSKME